MVEWGRDHGVDNSLRDSQKVDTFVIIIFSIDPVFVALFIHLLILTQYDRGSHNIFLMCRILYVREFREAGDAFERVFDCTGVLQIGEQLSAI